MVQYIRGRTGNVSLRFRLGAKGLERKQRLFVVACCRRIWSLLSDERSRQSVEVAERYADGMASAAELQSAYDAAAIVESENRSTLGGRRRNAAMPAAEVSRIEFSFNILMGAMDIAALVPADVAGSSDEIDPGTWESERIAQAWLLRDIFGNPFRPVSFDPSWRTSTVTILAQTMYDSRDFSAIPILADALEDAGCANEEILTHCRDPEHVHTRGCWVTDGCLGKG
jgi:hypothetical protein